MNKMLDIVLEKITLNMGAGDDHPKVEASKKVLEILTGKKVVITKTRKRNTFGIAKGRDTGAMVTIRGKAAEELLKKMMIALEHKIKPSQFDDSGNFSFGIKEYIHIPGINYDPDIGILGLDIAVTLRRAGFSVRKRKYKRSTVGKDHLIKKEESQEWAKNFGFKLVEKEEETYY